MRFVYYMSFVLIICAFCSCEEVIDLDLNTANPKYVIEADLNDLSSSQSIRISQTVNFDEPYPSKPVAGGNIVVKDVSGKTHNFNYNGDGIYRNLTFKPLMNGVYSLNVTIDGQEYRSSTRRVPYVDIDSLGIKKEKILNDYYYSITFKFKDPKDTDNYYKYSYSNNGKPFKFAAVFSDKFNNGLVVTHEITERDKNNKFEVGDSIVVRRECINKDVYNFWNELQSINPGSAAPANPTSNISNGALGYFSVSSAKLYTIVITEIDMVALR